MDFLLIPAADAQKILLILARVAAIFFVAPIFDNRSLPNLFRIGFALILSVVLFPAVDAGEWEVRSPLPMVVYLVKEILVGMILGMAVDFIFGAVRLAGQIVGFQMGLGIVAIIDPFTSSQSSVITQFYDFMAILFFFSFDAHHMVIRAMAESFQFIPFGGLDFSGSLLSQIIHLSGQMFLLAMKIAVPVLAVSFFVDMGLALLARTVPQMNVFILGFPLKIGVGLLAIGLSATFFGILLRKVFFDSGGQIHGLLRAM
ncbi:MAG: flagellar biosynthetic protein FliR [Deltaproteobacteria bacterium]|nr:flagellar biosynthetic protein FliR [Deltaproteobacteria bacterium]